MADVEKVSILGKESIHCGLDLIPYIAETVTATLPSSTYVLITDSNIAPLYLSAFDAAFRNAPRFLSHIIPPGETSKSRQRKADVEDFLLLHSCTRDTVILALGGGVIGDLAGFVAATFMRGVRFVQIPTTLLAMVDSAIGGKTAIDTPHGKNLIGAFWQPDYVFIDAAFLRTLPPREFSNGMAEVVKTAAIWDEAHFAALESRPQDLFAAIRTPSAGTTPPSPSPSPAQALLLSVVRASIYVKAHIVTLDERETGLRNLVNFGHTIGHAIEALLTPALLHGECVAVGMVLEAEIARAMGILPQGPVARLTRCLHAYGLPTSLRDPRIATLPAARSLNTPALLDIMRVDKKNSGTAKKIVLLARIGKTYEEKATVVPDARIARVLADAVTVVVPPADPAPDPVRLATPGSKSISNRALLLAALGTGTCRLKNLLHSDDTQVMITALAELQGAKFSWEDHGDTLVVEGGGGALTPLAAGKELYLGNAGTAARFLTAVSTLVRAPPDAPPTVLTGNARMHQRPIGPLVDALRATGAAVAYRGAPGSLPLAVAPGGFPGGRIPLAADVSSQFVSALLLTAPHARAPVELALAGGRPVSQAYIDMTCAMLRAFGVRAERARDPASGAPLDVYRVPCGAYANPAEYVIESDASSATYPLALAALTGTTCTVLNVGAASLQGDARFALDVLAPMGCTVTQTASETTVRGPPPGGLRPLGRIDMEPMTDAFLTASVLAAVATAPPEAGRELPDAAGPNATRIVGIANQRVKECDRIRAMVDELAKFGVHAVELPDGLEIHGRPRAELARGVRVRCYDDHRVAMAFGVLAAAVPRTVITERRCVEKTWPGWWDDLENKMGMQVEAVELEAAEPPAPARAAPDADATIFLIGMRGAGKTHIGRRAAALLGRPFLDADAHFAAAHPGGVRAFVRAHGWPAFRAAEAALLQGLLRTHARGHVVSLGGGVVEAPAARALLAGHVEKGGAVVQVVRALEEVERYLDGDGDDVRPAYGEPVADVFRRRAPWFAECANFEFLNDAADAAAGPDAEQATHAEVARFFAHVSGVRPHRAPDLGARRTYFLSLALPDVAPALPQMDALTAGADAVELRVDLLRPAGADAGAGVPPAAYVAAQLAALRRATPLPVVYTLRTAAQGGAFPDGKVAEAAALLDLGLRLGAEYLDVEVSWPAALVAGLVARKGSSQIIASWHDWSGDMRWDGPAVREKYELARRVGDIVKLVGMAGGVEDNVALCNFVAQVAKAPHAKPLIAINMGAAGQMSRVLNTTLTPVTHPLLPAPAAPGQLSFADIQRALHLLGLLPARRFWLLGSPVARSPSPALHAAAFRALGLPHTYAPREAAGVDDAAGVRALLAAADFGGASVTIPLKRAVLPLLAHLSPAAAAIGAVNTIVPRAGGLCGDNTDWVAIRDCVRRHVGPADGGIEAALVIGAGGTARAAVHALHALGARTIYVCNRTPARAEAVRAAFPAADVRPVARLAAWPTGAPPPRVIVSAVPAHATTADADAGGGGAVHLPAALFAAPRGVAVDMAYRPAETPLLTLAARAAGWTCVRGVEVLVEQGCAQCEVWTGRRCPRGEVAAAVYKAYDDEGLGA